MALSRSQVERLGGRLLSRSPPAADDLAMLHELLLVHGDALARALAIVQGELGLAPTARVKSTGSILDKLGRYGGSWLKSIQDLAGMRIVGSFDRDGQDAIGTQLVAAFAASGRRPLLVDRRERPSHGYRALHVIAFVGDVPVEIQVRTQLQHEWAELFEKLADKVGRGIRYGAPPDPPPSSAERSALSFRERRRYREQYVWRKRIVKHALRVADLIDGAEEMDWRLRWRSRDGSAYVPMVLPFVQIQFDHLRRRLERL